MNMMNAVGVFENTLRNKLVIIETIGHKEHVLCYAMWKVI